MQINTLKTANKCLANKTRDFDTFNFDSTSILAEEKEL